MSRDVAGAAVVAREQRALAAGVKDIGIRRIGRDVAALAAAHAVHAVAAPRAAASRRVPPAVAGDADGASCPAARRRRDRECRWWSAT